MSKMQIAVLMTCHNRREITLRCLESLYAQKLPNGVSFNIFLVDDGCTDGTGAAVKAAYPDINVIQGTGDLFWCNGMRLAWDHAAKEDPDYYLWLNDDVVLYEDAIPRLLETWKRVQNVEAVENVQVDGEGRFNPANFLPTAVPPEAETNLTSAEERFNDFNVTPVIVVGSTCDPETGEHTYGGQRRPGKHPAKLVPVLPQDVPVECDTFEGNVVLVPRAVVQKIGMMDRFRHAMGDTDYGYRAKKAGCRIWIAPGFFGTCHGNSTTTEALNRENPLSERWRFRVSDKGLPPRDWFKFLTRHAGFRGVVYWGWSYLKVCLGMHCK